MKISQETLYIIKNMASINANLLIREGNVLSTLSVSQSVFMHTTVEETFPREVCIYDLNSLIALLSIAQDQEVEFGEKSMTIINENGQFEYFYADKNVLGPKYEQWPQKTPPTDGFYTFEMSQDTLNMATKAASILESKMISFIGDGTNVVMSVGDPSTPSSNLFKKTLGTCERKFDAKLGIDNFKIIPSSYTVTLSDKKFAHFKNTSKDLAYWYALDRTSKYN